MIAHAPAPLIVTEPAAVTEHAVLDDENVTGRVELAVAATLNPASPKVLSANASNVIVCAALPTVSDCVASFAAL